MSNYTLTPSAQADLENIARYTIEQWGEAQSQRYAALIEKCCSSIAAGTIHARSISDTYPNLYAVRCEHHYIFYLNREEKTPTIIAVLHERMDMLERLRRVLSGPVLTHLP